MKKNLVKNIILAATILVLVFILGFKGIQHYLSNTLKVTEKASKIDAPSSIASADSTEPEDKSKLIDNTPPKKIYTILGDSNKLSQKEKANKDVWVGRIVQLAYANIDRLFVNGFTNEKKVCLTFDDGPDSINTMKALNILKQNNVKASFFFIGENVKLYPNTVKEAYSDGNLVLSHSYSHPELTKLNERDIDKQLQMTEKEIYKAIGKRPAIIRPPYGDVNQNVIDILSKSNYKAVLWSIDTLDWSQKEKANIVNNVVNNIRPGDIILMHTTEDKKATIEALPEIITKLKEKGYSFVTLDELLNVSAYK